MVEYGKDLEIKKLNLYIKVKLRMVFQMVLVFCMTLMEVSMWVVGRMGKRIDKEHSLTLMEKSMRENGRMGDCGTEQDTTKTETSHTSMMMEEWIKQ